MDWLEVTVYVRNSGIDELVGELEEQKLGGLVINDEASIREFLDSNPSVGDYIDDDVFNSVKGGSSVQFYLENNEEGRLRLETCRKALPNETFEIRSVNDEDWLNSWRKYFKPIEIGRRLLIVPAWEGAPADTDRVILRIEPGQVFGTGAHASTSMCLAELENHEAQKVLDLGCGSGILAVGALLCGAREAVCCDIAEDAEAVCYENARLNGLSLGRLKAYTCDILDEYALMMATRGERFDLVFANIIADVIIPLAKHVKSHMTEDGVFICSGIIDGRQDEVRVALSENGLQIISECRTDDWYMLVSRQLSKRRRCDKILTD